MKSHLIDVSIEYHPDGCWAITSKNLTGMVLAGKDIQALIADVPNAIKLLYKLNFQQTVEVALADDEVGGLETEVHSAFIPLPHQYVAMSAAA